MQFLKTNLFLNFNQQILFSTILFTKFESYKRIGESYLTEFFIVYLDTSQPFQTILNLISE